MDISYLLSMPETIASLQAILGDGYQRGVGKSPRDEAGVIGNVPADVLETMKSYTFYLDVPGIPKSEIQVTLEDEFILVIRSNGKRKRDIGEDEGCKYLRLERKAMASRFTRKFRLPEDANTSAITAKCEDGVLTVVVEKLPPPDLKPKTVEVTVT